MDYILSKLDIQFLSTLMANTAGLSGLDKVVAVDDFNDRIYYEIYLAIVDFLIDNKVPSYQDIKFKFKDDDLVREIIEAIQTETDAPDDLDMVYNELCEKSRMRKIEQIGHYLQMKGVSESKSEDIIRIAEAQLLQVTLNYSINIDTVADLEAEYLMSLKDRMDRYRQHGLKSVIDLPTGYISIDEYTLGLQKKNTWILGGGTSDGKTEMAVQISNSVIGAENQVLFFMLEDDKNKLLNRFISLKSGTAITKLMCGNLTDGEFDKVKQISNQLKQGNKLLIEDETFDINEIVTKAQFTKLKYPNLNLIVIDHINLIMDKSLKEGSREREIGTASKKLIALAKKINVAILILQQLNTNPDERKKGLPVTVNDLRDCKSTGHDASVVMLLNCPNRFDEDAKFSKKHTQIILAKNRYGEVNKIIDLINYAHVGKFVEGRPRGETTKVTT